MVGQHGANGRGVFKMESLMFHDEEHEGRDPMRFLFSGTIIRKVRKAT